MVFDGELDNFDIYFTKENNIIRRKYCLNNQYTLINGNQITRDITQIRYNNYSSWGIELNDLLLLLTKFSSDYLNFQNELKQPTNETYNYLNSIKLIINKISENIFSNNNL